MKPKLKTGTNLLTTQQRIQEICPLKKREDNRFQKQLSLKSGNKFSHMQH